ncbi:hypothetical protein HCX48_01655 [Rhodocyclus tenuis]|uniref:DUF4148 domain-containing protein n=1 Tax=Rhodocyclus gracilis TaxID=2929842 RepID=A0ABX0WHL6_9RHOO|nr:hypothetical protein [Rhodocyclus gracilis]NJA87933.1 hypothetical protein [Rhodocyclus gracilis]
MGLTVFLATLTAAQADPFAGARQNAASGDSSWRDGRGDTEAAPSPRSREMAPDVTRRMPPTGAGDSPGAARSLHFSSEERRQLRRDVHEAGRDLYGPRR